LNSENCLVVDSRISPGNRTQSRRCASVARQQSCPRQGEWMGHHRGLRAGHGFTGVTRELGRASRLLGNKSRSEGDRHNQHPGVPWPTRPADEPNPTRVGRDTKKSASTQGTGRERQANRPGRTKAVVATPRTAGQGATSAQKRGEPRPKGPRDKGRKAAGRQCRGMTSVPGRGRRDFEPATCLNETGTDCTRIQAQAIVSGRAATVMSPVVS
jgi:hypothetical protein